MTTFTPFSPASPVVFFRGETLYADKLNQALAERTATISMGDTPPTDPWPGQLWFDSSNPQLYIWYVDPTSAQWVIATAYAGGLTSDAPSDGQVYGRQNGAWSNIAAGGAYLPLIGGTLTGALSINPPGSLSFLPGVSQQNPIFMSKTSWTGTTARTGQFGYMNWIDIVSDDAFLDDSGASAFRITHNYGGGTQFAGGRVGLSVTMYQVTGATGTFPKDTNQQRIAIQAQVHAAENASGTSSTDPAGVSGSIYSLAGYTRLFGPGSVVDGQGVSHPVSGATNYNDCIGMNMNMRVETGASCYAKEFIHLAQELQDQTQGSVSDACIMIANQPGAIGWRNIMALGRPNGAWPLPLDGTGKIFGTYRGTGLARMQAGYGIDWRDISFNTAAIATPGFVVDGFGNTGISALSLATSGQTTTVDANRIHVLSATVVTSTGTWGPSMGMYDASGNQWAVGTTDASRNLLTVTLVAPAYITGAPPANPVTVIANSGSAAQATLNLTWSTSPGTLALQPSGGKITSAPLTNAANDAAAATAGVPLNGWYRNGSVMMQRVA